MKKLFTAGRIGELRLKNRAVMSPMEVLYGEMNGSPGPRAIAYYEERARGGVGLIIVEATAVDETNNVPWQSQLRITDDSYICAYQQLAEAIHKYDCKAFIQLHHYGAKSDPVPGGEVWGVSGIPAMPGGRPAHAMTVEEIKVVERRFVDAAARAQKAGFDGVELAGAHGYLLAQFLSPYYNDRTDEYGGSAENRCRIVTEIIEAIHRELGRGFAVSVRFPGDECTPDIPGTMTAADGPVLAKIFERAGADVLNVSYGNNFNADANCEPYSYRSGWKRHIAKAVKDSVGIPVISTNTIKDPEFAEQMLEEGVSDFVALGRSLIADPNFMRKAEAGDTVGIRKCIGCMFCREQLYARLPIRCALNPRAGCEAVYPAVPERDGEGRSVAVIGGGPAGMQAAEVLAQRGFDVSLFEKEERLGGSMNLADKGQFKEKITRYTETMTDSLGRLGVKLHLGAAPDIGAVKAEGPEGVVLAFGAEPIVPASLPGIGSGKVVTVHDVISGKAKVSGRVVIVGAGMTGLECAEKLCLEGCRVALADMQDKVGSGMFSVIISDLMSRILPHEPEIYTGHALLGITDRGVSLRCLADGSVKELEADWVVLSLGVRPDAEAAERFYGEFGHVVSVGDCVKSGRIPHATKDGYIKALCFLK